MVARSRITGECEPTGGGLGRADQIQVVLFQGGEDNGALFTGYLTNKTLSGVYAQEVGGAALLLERKYPTRRAARSPLIHSDRPILGRIIPN